MCSCMCLVTHADGTCVGRGSASFMRLFVSLYVCLFNFVFPHDISKSIYFGVKKVKGDFHESQKSILRAKDAFSSLTCKILKLALLSKLLHRFQPNSCQADD